MNTAALIDGRLVSTASEAWRHECEARHIAKLPTRAQRQDYIGSVTQRRGPAAAQALQALATQIYTAQRATAQG